MLHDSHAEILALRALNHTLLSECHALLRDGLNNYTSSFVRRRNSNEIERAWEGNEPLQPFQIKEDVQIWMFCTEAPCGDASMEVLIAEQEIVFGGEAPIPWTRETSVTNQNVDEVAESGSPLLLDGRGYFSELGVVRRKPSRSDALQSLSKSCTDKLTLRQVVSLLSSPASLLIAPSRSAYLNTLLLPQEQFSAVACTRAFSGAGRLASFSGKVWPKGYTFQPFEVRILESTGHEFEFAKPRNGAEKITKPGNISAVWTCGPGGKGTGINEVLINGVKQGYKQTSDDERKASTICRRGMWSLVREIMDLLTKERGGNTEIAVENSFELPFKVMTELETAVKVQTYRELKESRFTLKRREVKRLVTEGLGGWIENARDCDWNLDRE